MASLMATLGANIAPFLKNLDQAQVQAKSKGEGLGSALGGSINRKLAGLVSVGAIEEVIRQTVEYGSKINDLALRLGISTDAVQQWDYALKQSGSSIDAATGFFEKLAINRAKALAGNEDAIESFRKLGVSLEQLKTQRVEDIAAVIAKAFQSGDPQKLIAPLREIGGKSAGELITAFREGLGAALSEAPLISSEDIAALDRAGDAWSRLKAEFTAASAPVVTYFTERALNVINFARDALKTTAGAVILALRTVATPGATVGLEGRWFSKGDQPKPKAPGPAFTGAGDEESGPESQKALDAIQRQIDAEERKGDLQERTAIQKAEYLDAELKTLTRKAALEKDALERKKLELEIARVTNEFNKAADTANTERIKEDEKAAKEKLQTALGKARSELTDEEGLERLERHRDVALRKDLAVGGALSAIGGSLGTGTQTSELANLDLNRKSEQHLSVIRREIQKMTTQLATLQGKSTDDVAF
jgi:hypothetical protein